LSVHKTSPVVADDQMKSCLHYAVEKKYLSVVQVLLDHDAYVLAKDKDGRMAVEIAISMKNDAIAACLVSKMPHDR
jgi:ankyrin repeat protein